MQSLSLHDALPIFGLVLNKGMEDTHRMGRGVQSHLGYSYADRIHVNTHHFDEPLVPRKWTVGVTERVDLFGHVVIPLYEQDRKSTRLNSSHVAISYAVFCLKKKNETNDK